MGCAPRADADLRKTPFARPERLTLSVACLWMVSAGILYLVAPSALVGLFQSNGAEAEALISIGSSMLVLSALWQLFDAASMTFSETLRAAGDTTWPMWARIVTARFVFTPLSWLAIFVFDGGVTSVMLSMVGYITLLSALLALRFASGRWRSIELVEPEPEPGA